MCHDSAFAHDRAAGAPEAEIEITPEMIEAGRHIFLNFDRRFDDEDECVANVYKSMELVRQSSGVR
jgi:hypothetical protein